MTTSGFRAATIVALAVIAAVLALGVARTTASSTASTGTPLAAHVFAPYFEAWTNDSMTTVAQQSGARYFTMAFLQTPKKGSCTITWNGDAGQGMSSGRYVSDLASLRALGGDMIPSFGGWSADQGGTEIADSCSDPAKIAQAYESVVTTYDVTRLDMDVEGRSLTKTDGIDRRNKAIKLLEDWAAANGRTVQISYTLPTTPTGLESTGIAILQNAIANGARVDVVSPMAFDYYDGTTKDMGAAAVSVANGLNAQLHTLYPAKSAAQLWAMEGLTLLPGIDDYPKKTEVTSLADAQKVLDFARANGMSVVSIWTSQRDNGGCPGTTDSNTCSGLAQSSWDFSRLLEPFTG
jgi:hypothetical protein